MSRCVPKTSQIRRPLALMFCADRVPIEPPPSGVLESIYIVSHAFCRE